MYKPGQDSNPNFGFMSVLLETTHGDIVIDLHVKESPKTCLNFLKLCKIKFYNFCPFFNVQKDFVVQVGDPTATGNGGSSIFGILGGEKYFKESVNPKLRHSKRGTVGMVDMGSGRYGSQFYITLNDDLEDLDERQVVFGQVSEGFDILEQINKALVDGDGRPYKDIRIKHTVILEDEFPDPKGLEEPSRSPSPTPEMLSTVRIAPDEEVTPINEIPLEVLEKRQREQEARANALTLEMLGDLPEADAAPPENVLFVCKLNPVTRDEDLELIFSRFGSINKCEIVKDSKTGESLGFGFIEFENKDDCEEAYFKMENVLIDDRRIHVDFSQSLHSYQPFTEERRKPSYKLKKRYQDKNDYDMLFDHETNSSNKTKSRRRSRSPYRK
ncbi:cyclophilin-like protein [Rozella allomycis CSF55]|uniref:Peptidyl-prolyl cis-trans isomerase n=1 Tax=Rozella allomycis (strain CSF55) TaxID=988480 RepID=A0A4P9YKV2_ROZAC|nr:cyclophilin-like protein [Rozella allomycis CSF55]